MRNFLIGLGLSLVILVVAALVVPSFIDWNQYRDRITAQVQGVTGRALTIDGDLSLSVLPTPALAADGVRLANMVGGSDPVMASVEAVRVNVAIAPLLRGDVVVQSVEIIKPDILLERLEDGRANWELSLGSSGQGQAGGPLPGGDDPAGSDGQAGGGLSISLDKVRLVDGVLRYRDAVSGLTEEVRDINMTLAAQSLSGPFSAKGSLTPRGVPLAVQLALGTLREGQATSVALRVDQGAGGEEGGPASVEFNGLLTDPTGQPILRGDLALVSGDPIAALAALEPVIGPTPDLPGPLTRPMDVRGKLSASAQDVALEDLVVTAADTEAKGRLAATLGGTPAVDLSLTFTRVDLDGWVTTAMGIDPAGGSGIREASLGGGLVSAAHAQESGGTEASAANTPAAGPVQLPTNLDVTVDLSADAATYNGSALRDLRLNAGLSEGEVTVNELSARMPGASDLSAFGFVHATEAGPSLDLTVNATSGDLRALMDWLRVDVGGVPGDRLRALKVQGTLAGTPELVKVTGLDATLDTTRFKGAFTIRPGDRLGIGATMRVDALNVDAYLPAGAGSGGAGAPSATDGGSASDGGTVADGDVDPTAKGSRAAPLFAGLEALNTFDASFDLAVDRLTVGGAEYHGLSAKGALVNGLLTLSDAGLEQGLGGLRANLSGGLTGFGGAPDLRDLAYDLRVSDPARVARTLMLTLPVPAEKLGSVALLGTLSGGLDDLTVDSRVIAAQADLQAQGRVLGALSGLPSVELDTALKHPDLVTLTRLFMPDYTPKGRPGAVDVTAHVAGGLDQVTLSELGGRVGETAIGGNVTLTPSVNGVKTVADLNLGNVVLDNFLPAEKAAWRMDPLGRQGGAGPREASSRFDLVRPGPSPLFQTAAAAILAPGSATHRRLEADLAAAPWSSDPIDLSALDSLDADVTLKAASLTHDGYTLENADIKALARDGVLDLSRLNGDLFGGRLTGSGKVVNGQSPNYDLDLGLEGLQVARYLSLFGGAAGAQGGGDLTLKMNSQGLTTLDIIQALAGSGGIDLKGVDLNAGSLRGQGLAGLLELVGLLNDAASLGMSDGGLADLSGSFTIDQGVVSFDPFSLVSRLYQGAVSGTVDLANWTVDAEGTADLAESTLSNLLGKAIKLPDSIPFSLAGNIDNPVIKVATASLPKGGTQGAAESVIDQVAPDATKELNKVLPGAGDLLNGVLGGGSNATEGEGGESSSDGEGTQTQEAPAQKLMRGLLKGLGG